MKMFAMIFSLVVTASSPVWAQQTQQCDDGHKISVNGEAVIYAKPDKILVSFGIETWDKDIMIAKQKNNAILKKAMASIKSLGVPEKEIQTDHLSIEPRYESDYRKENFIGYFVRNAFVVTLTDTAKVEELVTKALESGVNFIQGIDFQTTEFKKYREQARELALKAAKEKAMKMAEALGQSIGTPVLINDSYGGSWYYSGWSGWGSGRSQGMSQNAIQNIRGGSGEVADTIALGKMAIRADVSVTFDLKK